MFPMQILLKYLMITWVKILLNGKIKRFTLYKGDFIFLQIVVGTYKLFDYFAQILFVIREFSFEAFKSRKTLQPY